MLKSLLAICLLFCYGYSFSQSDDFKYFLVTADDGLIVSTDYFKDYIYAGEEISTDLKAKINKAIQGHQKSLKFNDTLSIRQLESYKELIFLYKTIGKSSLKYSERIYEYLNKDRRYIIYTFDVVKDLVLNYNRQGKPELSKQVLEKNIDILNNHKYFSCDTGSSYYYRDLASLYYKTYVLLNDFEMQMIYGFKYLLNQKQYSKSILETLIANYSKVDIRKAFDNLQNNFVEKRPMTDSYFKFLDFKIGTRGYSGVYHHSRETELPFEQLKKTLFYKNLLAYLSK